jgi:hypothetical protein
MTVLIRNAANLAILLHNASKISDGNVDVKNVFLMPL